MVQVHRGVESLVGQECEETPHLIEIRAFVDADPELTLAAVNQSSYIGANSDHTRLIGGARNQNGSEGLSTRVVIAPEEPTFDIRKLREQFARINEAFAKDPEHSTFPKVIEEPVNDMYPGYYRAGSCQLAAEHIRDLVFSSSLTSVKKTEGAEEEDPITSTQNREETVPIHNSTLVLLGLNQDTAMELMVEPHIYFTNPYFTGLARSSIDALVESQRQFENALNLA